MALLTLQIASVGLLTGVGWIHLHLWEIGYKHIPTIGPLFIAAAVSAFAVAVALLLRSSRLLALSALGLSVGIVAGLVVSVNFGLFGFTESLRAPFAIESVVLELASAVCLATWVGLDYAQQCRYTRRLLELGSAPRLGSDRDRLRRFGSTIS